jgi:hypothetical protein
MTSPPPGRTIAALMRGESGSWSADLLEAAQAHGALPLIAWQLRRSGETLPPELEQAARIAVAVDTVRQRELGPLLERLDSAAIAAVVVKGEALARTHYAHSSLRPRCDADVFIEPELVAHASDVLRAAGYGEEPGSGGEYISRQRMWVRVDGVGVRHCIDLHWALSNRERYARTLPFGELWSRGIMLYGEHVRMPCAADALLLAAVHLAGHHRGQHRLIWLYDIHLLHAGLGVDDLQEAALRARARKADLALDAALALAMQWFGDGRHETAPLMPQGEVADLIDDLRCVPGVRGKLRIVREHLFPPAAYVLQKYRATSRRSLPALYLRRAVSRLLRRTK